MAKRWIILPAEPTIEPLANQWNVEPIIAQLLFNRSQRAYQSVSHFLDPQLKNMDDPGVLPGVPEASALIADAIHAKSRIVLYGDYDVDGITGVAILWHVLSLGGAEVSFYVPHRVDEGYGLNPGAVRQIIEDGAKMVITVDCGVSSAAEVDLFRNAGVKVVVSDHHNLQGPLPNADAVVHPSLADQPGADLCGAGVAFKLGWGVAQVLSGGNRVNDAFRQLLVELLPLAALGTIADVVPLIGENRIIAKHGLARLGRTSLVGLRALIESSGLSGGAIDGQDVGFKLAPRINAAGRMGHARLAVELLTRADSDRAREIALYLEDHNRSRQATERRILKQAIECVEGRNLAGDARRAIVVASEGWHAGVIGIVAARLVDRYHRPVVVIALSGDQGQGSCRSISSFNITDGLRTCGAHLISFGGHDMAAGLKIAPDSVAAFTDALVETANNLLTPADLIPRLRLDAEVLLNDLNLATGEAMARLGPFGAGNPKPKFATDWIELADEPRAVGRGESHLQASFRQNGKRMKAIGFGMAHVIETLKEQRRCQVAFTPIINDFNGRRTVEMQMLDIRFPD